MPLICPKDVARGLPFGCTARTGLTVERLTSSRGSIRKLPTRSQHTHEQAAPSPIPDSLALWTRPTATSMLRDKAPMLAAGSSRAIQDHTAQGLTPMVAAFTRLSGQVAPSVSGFSLAAAYPPMFPAAVPCRQLGALQLPSSLHPATLTSTSLIKGLY